MSHSYNRPTNTTTFSACAKLLLVFSIVTASLASVADTQSPLAVQSRVHFNTNVSNFEVARAFYGQLGFETLSGFPDTNTLEMAAAIGIETPTEYDGSKGAEAGGYLLHGELIGLGFNKGVIDLIEFSIPRNESPPYRALNHLGMARAVLNSSNVQADYNALSDLGVTFLSQPVTRSNGEQFVVFKDPDGTFYEIRQRPGEVDDDAPTHIHSVGAVSINVSDFERSANWYGRLGFELTAQLSATETLEVAQAMGFSQPFTIRGGVFTHRIDGTQLELVEWITPYDATPPYPAPINHLGIHRIAFSTTDIEGDVAKLRAAGVEFISDITPCCSGNDSWGGIVAFYDPDGTIVELVEQPLMTIMAWFMRLFS